MDEEWRIGMTYIVGNGWEAEVIATFDHDYEHHLLFMVFPEVGESFYALFFAGAHMACLVQRWDGVVGGHPWLAAAEVVQGWSELAREAHGS